MSYVPVEDRYERMAYRRSGRSGLLLPVISLGLWHNFGDEDDPLRTGRAIIRRAFDLGITHFDLANNYGRPYGEWGSRKYLLASLDQSLNRMGLEYVDIFYSHRFDPETPLEETMGALDSAVRQGKALYAGISSYSAKHTAQAAAILRDLGTPLLIHQPSYSLLNRWIEDELLDTLEDEGVGCIVFSPLAQGLLTDKYLRGIPEGSRASRDGSFSPRLITDETIAKIRALNELAGRRGQSLAQMALAWTLRDRRVTSALIGVSSVAQLEANIAAVERLDFTSEELEEIERHATDSGINIWAASSER